MSSALRATRAYQTASESRSQRMQEADVFYRATGSMRSALNGSEMDRIRAVSDNRQLWLTVMGLVQNPENRLPAQVRAAIISVGRSVQRELDAPSPDLHFMIAVNENIAAGLSAVP